MIQAGKRNKSYKDPRVTKKNWFRRFIPFGSHVCKSEREIVLFSLGAFVNKVRKNRQKLKIVSIKNDILKNTKIARGNYNIDLWFIFFQQNYNGIWKRNGTSNRYFTL